MLNIKNRISLSKQAKRQIKKLKKKLGGSFNGNSWTAISSSIKNEISKKLLIAHSPKCVYCERYLIATGNEIDHFAHKAIYSQFVFNTVNLFNSCKYCNSSARKGQKETIVKPIRDRYNECVFSIVHPFFDNPDQEIVYLDSDRINYDWDNCSQKGKNTIDFFKWHDTQMTLFRAKILKKERLDPLTSTEEIELIQQIITYKKKI